MRKPLYVEAFLVNILSSKVAIGTTTIHEIFDHFILIQLQLEKNVFAQAYYGWCKFERNPAVFTSKLPQKSSIHKISLEMRKKSKRMANFFAFALSDKVRSVMRTVSHRCAHSKTFMRLPARNMLFKRAVFDQILASKGN